MKKIFFLLLPFLSCSIVTSDMQKYLNKTQELVKQKKYKEANERYIWFHNHALEYEPAMSGVRTSFALSYWKSLADVYSPALQTMKEIRDKKTMLLIDSNATTSLFADVTAFNREFDEEIKTVELFKKIDSLNHDKAKKCWLYAKDALFKYKQYDILSNYIGNPIAEFQSIIEKHKMLLETPDTSNKEVLNSLQEYANETFVENCINLINFSLAIKDVESANKIKNEALQIVKDNRLKAIETAKR